jgi:transcription initiation factor IIE alpha subunit
MGATKQCAIEEFERESAEREREYDAGCPLCDNELDLDDCEALYEALSKDD